jgi:hypothetical protein
MGILDSIKEQVMGGLGSTVHNRKSLNTDLYGGSSTDPALKHRNYAVIIKQDQEGKKPGFKIVVGAAPETFQITQDIDWKAPFGGGMVGGNTGDLLAMSGTRTIGHVTTMQVWQGAGNDTTFTTEFTLQAWSDPYKDVIQPLQTLLEMSMPSLNSVGFLSAPGPTLTKKGYALIGQAIPGAVEGVFSAFKNEYNNTLGDGSKNQIAPADNNPQETKNPALKDEVEKAMTNKISISIGTWFKLNNIIITNVQHSLDSQMPEAKTGLLLSANVSLQFKPVFALTAEDIKSLLQGSPNQVGSPLFGSTTAVPN